MTSPHILLTTDLSDESTRSFDAVGRLATELRARITLLHVVSQPPVVAGMPDAPIPMQPDLKEMAVDARKRLGELRTRLPADLPVDVVAETGVATGQSIVDYAKREKVDYIAMSTHGRSGLERLLVGSVAESVLRHAVTPLLLYPSRDSD